MYLALDVGDIRIGTALAQLEGSLVTPHQTFQRAKGLAEKEILGLIEQYSIRAVIVGLPLSEDGKETEQSEKIRQFVRRLSRRTKVRFEFIDEYGTSGDALDLLKLGSPHRSKKKTKKLRASGAIDALSAAMILESYLNNRSKDAL